MFLKFSEKAGFVLLAWLSGTLTAIGAVGMMWGLGLRFEDSSLHSETAMFLFGSTLVLLSFGLLGMTLWAVSHDLWQEPEPDQ